MFLFLVLPILLVTRYVGVDSWLWRGVLLAGVAAMLAWSGVAGLVSAVAIIIIVAFKSSLHGITGTSV
ncbi:MAG: hypothetical protein ACRELC_04775 [Gemmatimonadota bacterium]